MRTTKALLIAGLTAILLTPAPASASTLALAEGSLDSTLDLLGLSVWSTETEARETGDGSACPPAHLLRAFAAWNDPADYKLVPGGDFEGDLTGWQLAGGAQIVRGGSPYGVTGKSSAFALRLPAGARATTPPVCIAPGSPVARMFGVTRSTGSGASLGVELIDAAGDAKPAGQLPALSSWDAGRRFSLAQGRALKGGKDGTAQLRIRLTAVGEAWEVDEIFVDPRSLG